MGWEYRILFKPVPGFTKRVFEEELGPSVDVEDRVDQYVPHSAVVGIKFRGGGGLEIKTRRDVDNLGFEKWDKIQCEGGIQALNEKLATLGHCSPPPDLPHIRLAKRRTRCKGPRCTFEETDVVVRYHAAPSTEDRVNSVGNGGAPVPLDSLSEEVWRSVAVEGKRKACTNLQATLLLRVAAAAGPGARILVCGYAEFVATMAAQDDAEATKATMAIEDASDVPGGAQLGRASI